MRGFINDYGDLEYYCSNCGSKHIDDAGHCEDCHGAPYYDDEWYDEDDGYGLYEPTDTEELRALLYVPSPWERARAWALNLWARVRAWWHRGDDSYIPF